MRCFFYKALISHTLDNDGTLSKKVRAHLALCESCRSFHLSCASLSDTLNRAAATGVPHLHASLTPRVTKAIRDRETPSSYKKMEGMIPAWRTALVNSVALLLVTGLLLFHPVSGDTTSNRSISEAVNSLSLIGKDMMQRYLPQEREKIWLACVAEPLTSEVDRLSENAETLKRVFIDFLPIHRVLNHINRSEDRDPPAKSGGTLFH